MTIYVHFRTPGTIAKKLHNVLAVEDHGPYSIRVRFLFSDDRPEFSDVRNVAIEPDTEPDTDA